jgi:hypothetical protein
MLYDKNKIIFVHIPKNGGTSITKVLSKYIKCTHHNVNFDKIKDYNNLIVIRDPISRFISSVNYTINHYREENINNILLDNNYTSPNQWACAFFDTNHEYHKSVIKSIKPHRLRTYDRINNQKLDIKWQFAHQNLWHHNPSFVLLFDNLNIEFSYFCTNILQRHNLSLIKNNISYGDNFISDINKTKIINYYYSDYILYNKYKSMDLKDRIPIKNTIQQDSYNYIWI